MSEQTMPETLWAVIDAEEGECVIGYFGLHARDYCHDHIKDSQEEKVQRARHWVVREFIRADIAEQRIKELEDAIRKVVEASQRYGHGPDQLVALCIAAETCRQLLEPKT